MNVSKGRWLALPTERRLRDRLLNTSTLNGKSSLRALVRKGRAMPGVHGESQADRLLGGASREALFHVEQKSLEPCVRNDSDPDHHITD